MALALRIWSHEVSCTLINLLCMMSLLRQRTMRSRCLSTRSSSRTVWDWMRPCNGADVDLRRTLHVHVVSAEWQISLAAFYIDRRMSCMLKPHVTEPTLRFVAARSRLPRMLLLSTSPLFGVFIFVYFILTQQVGTSSLALCGW